MLTVNNVLLEYLQLSTTATGLFNIQRPYGTFTTLPKDLECPVLLSGKVWDCLLIVYLSRQDHLKAVTIYKPNISVAFVNTLTIKAIGSDPLETVELLNHQGTAVYKSKQLDNYITKFKKNIIAETIFSCTLVNEADKLNKISYTMFSHHIINNVTKVIKYAPDKAKYLNSGVFRIKRAVKNKNKLLLLTNPRRFLTSAIAALYPVDIKLFLSNYEMYKKHFKPRTELLDNNLLTTIQMESVLCQL